MPLYACPLLNSRALAQILFLNFTFSCYVCNSITEKLVFKVFCKLSSKFFPDKLHLTFSQGSLMLIQQCFEFCLLPLMCVHYQNARICIHINQLIQACVSVARLNLNYPSPVLLFHFCSLHDIWSHNAMECRSYCSGIHWLCSTAKILPRFHFFFTGERKLFPWILYNHTVHALCVFICTLYLFIWLILEFCALIILFQPEHFQCAVVCFFHCVPSLLCGLFYFENALRFFSVLGGSVPLLLILSQSHPVSACLSFSFRKWVPNGKILIMLSW